MAKQKKAAKKVMNRKSMKRTKGGSLNAEYLKLTGETQGKIKGSVSENQLGTIIKGVGSD